MLGAIIGDIIGSPFEYKRANPDFSLFNTESDFTDDTVMTVAVADAILNHKEYGLTMREWGQKYLDCGYGDRFYSWLKSRDPQPYNSYGNGSAMRVSSIGWFFHNEDEVLREAKKSAEVSHNHPEGIKGAQAVALSVFLSRNGVSKKDITQSIQKIFDYDLGRTLKEIRTTYSFHETCQETVPEAIICFLESTDFESAVRNAVTLGGDSDTLACISGAIAEAFYGYIPQKISKIALMKLPRNMKEIVHQFYTTLPLLNLP